MGLFTIKPLKCAVCGKKIKSGERWLFFKPFGIIQRNYSCHKRCLAKDAQDKLSVINELSGD